MALDGAFGQTGRTGQTGQTGPLISIDGGRPLSAGSVRALSSACDQAEDLGGAGSIRVLVSGAPEGAWSREVDVALVSKWERAVRRLERLAVTTVAVADGDCGGMALDVLLATDYRLATPRTRLLLPFEDGAAWPGMALYRLVQQAGAARTRRAVLFGGVIDAIEARELCLVDEVTDDPERALGESPEAAGAFCGTELAIRRRLMLDAATTSFENALGTHLAACDRQLRRAAAAGAGS